MNLVKPKVSLPVASEHYWPTEGWRTAAPEAQGLDSAHLAETIDTFSERNVNSMVIIRKGYIVAEAYREGLNEISLQDVKSVTKSFTSALTGIAIADNKLPGATAARVSDYFPEWSNVPLKGDVRVGHLLSMTSGLAWNNENEQSSHAMMAGENWVQVILNHSPKYAPGMAFNYSNGDAHLMSALLHKATGESLLDYAKSRLFAPLGIRLVNWNHDPQGHTIGSWSIGISARDMAKLGLLYMKDGEWEGKTIIPKGWIQESLVKRVILNHRDGLQGGYGYYWWSKPVSRALFDGDTKRYDAFYASGADGQRVFVVPELQLIVALTASSSDPEMPEQLLSSIIRAKRADKPLPEDAEAVAKLIAATQRFGRVTAGAGL